MAEFLKNARNNYKKLIVALAAVLAIYLLFTGVRVIVVILAMIVIGAGSTFYQIFFRSPINFELIKFVTILCSVVFGPVPAIIVGIISNFIGKMMTGKLEADFIASIIALVAISILASAFKGVDIVLLGIILVVVYHLIIFPIVLSLGGNIGYGVIYSGSNIIFNIATFNLLARPVLWILQNAV
ncbi:MAG TPA: hypothetical protein VJB90_00115 [Candidatus Nanoarchaeia archaeon]|uniref:Uncharacterized protein n=1 Tax=Candidatus Iainarchaeum sp. TaxID=3101447 RepID=A0A8T4KTH4_9ARCH|nr:hypothetical protein [Candidatus Diapherotrites archaeon]HLD18401.1 hypothetical protein [Candidatus Nanoarchaeia archaeon]